MPKPANTSVSAESVSDGLLKVWANGVRHYIGLFRWEKEAARAYDEAARRLGGTKFNFPQPGEKWCGPATHCDRSTETPAQFDLGLPYRAGRRGMGHGPDQ